MRVAFFVLVAGCGDEKDPSGDADSDVDTDADTDTATDTTTVDWPDPGEYGTACPLDDRVGLFEIAAFSAYSAVSGSVATGILPITIREEVGRAGDCRLLKKDNPFCDPPCVAGELCDDHDDNPDTNGVCAPYPPNLDAGTVYVRGLVEGLPALHPDAALNYSNTLVPHPIFDPGAEIQLYAEGADTESFSLEGAGVEVLDAQIDWTMVRDQPLEVTWTPGDGTGRIWLSFNVDQHGNSPVTLECDVEDTGSTIVPAALVTQLIDSGVSGFSTGLMRRLTVDSTQIEQGCVELLVYSHLRGQLQCEGCL